MPSFLNDVVSRLLVVLVTVLYFYEWISFDVFVWLTVLIYLFITIILLFYLSKFDLISFKIRTGIFNEIGLKKLIPYGLILCVISFTSYGLKSIDAIFLGMSSLSNVAVYSIAVFLALFIEVPLGSIERISHSKIAENYAKGNYAEIDKIYSESVKYLLIFGGFIFLGINACSKFIFDFLQPEYSQGIILVQILSFGCLINVSTGVNNAILYYTNHFKMGAVLLVFAFTITVILDIIFIPKYGMPAAALVTAFVSIMYNVLKFAMIYKIFGFQPYDAGSLKTLTLIVVGFCIVLFLPTFTHYPVVNILINGSIISVFYIACVYKLNLIPEIFETLKSRFVKR